MKAIFATLAIATLAACATTPMDGERAIAELKPTKGSKAFGEVTFEQAGNKVRLIANVQGLKAGQQHGFHIHEVGDCGGDDGMRTKGHFDPHGKPHGQPGSGSHAGDLPALSAGTDGRARLDVELGGLTISPGAASIVGRGLIVHADPDDFKTQPTGNSGARIACGVIQLE